MKRILCLSLVLTMICAMLTFTPASAATIVDSGNCGAEYEEDGARICAANGKNVSWTLYSNGTLTISGTGEMTFYDEFNDRYPQWTIYNNEIYNIIIEEGVTNIGDLAFGEFYLHGRYLNIKNISIADSVVDIGRCAFSGTPYYNGNETDNGIWIGDDLYIENHLIEINEKNSFGTFRVKDGTKSIASCAFFGNKIDSINSVIIPDSVKNIAESAFSYRNNLKTLTISSKLFTIKDFAFYECNNLSDIYYVGSKADWNKIVIGEGNDAFLNATIHYNSTMPSEATSTPIPTQRPTAIPTAKPTADPSAVSAEIIEVRNGFVTARVNNCDDTDARIILAVYNKNGALTEMQNYYNLGDVTFFSANLQNANIKVMLWSDTDSIKPLAETAEMSL